MKSKALIEKQTKKKTNSILVETIISAKKKDAWIEVAKILSGPRRLMINKNIQEINQEAEEGEHIIVPGKVLSLGEINKKIKISALGFSESARAKLIKSKSEISTILDEIKKNPGAKGVKILK
jgi:large subunit ribosomal protein L18e